MLRVWASLPTLTQVELDWALDTATILLVLEDLASRLALLPLDEPILVTSSLDLFAWTLRTIALDYANFYNEFAHIWRARIFVATSFSFCATHGACPCTVFFGWFGVVPTRWRLLPGVQVRLTLPFALLTLQSSWSLEDAFFGGWSNQRIHIFGTRLPWNLEISSLIVLSHFGSCLSEGWSSWCGLSMNPTVTSTIRSSHLLNHCG